jgi:hypothetical protein
MPGRTRRARRRSTRRDPTKGLPNAEQRMPRSRSTRRAIATARKWKQSAVLLGPKYESPRDSRLFRSHKVSGVPSIAIHLRTSPTFSPESGTALLSRTAPRMQLQGRWMPQPVQRASRPRATREQKVASPSQRFAATVTARRRPTPRRPSTLHRQRKTIANSRSAPPAYEAERIMIDYVRRHGH